MLPLRLWDSVNCRISAKFHSTRAYRAVPASMSQAASTDTLLVAAECLVAAREQPMRLDQALVELLPEEFPTASRSKRSIRRGEVLLDGVRANTTMEVRGGELVQWLQRGQGEAPDPTTGPPAGLPPLRVLYEDDHLACVVKPQGMPVDGGGGTRTTLQHCLPYALAPSGVVGAMRQPHYVHRLDEPTGGLVLIAKTWAAMRALGEAFVGRRITKRYRALAWGLLDGRGLVRFALDGKPSETEYLAVGHFQVQWDSDAVAGHVKAGATGGGPAAAGVSEGGPQRDGGSGGCSALEALAGGNLSGRDGSAGAAAEPRVQGSNSAHRSGGGGARSDWVTTLDLWPHTGRTHQLRRHLALLGHPLVGDRKYTHGYAKQRLEVGGTLPSEQHVRLSAAGKAEGADEEQQQQEEEEEEEKEEEEEQEQEEHPAAGAAPGGGAQLPGPAPSGAGQDAGVVSSTVDPDSNEPWPAAAGGAEGAKAGGGVAASPSRSSREASLEVLCLWAVQLDLQHPVTGVPLHFELIEPQIFGAVRRQLGSSDCS